MVFEKEIMCFVCKCFVSFTYFLLFVDLFFRSRSGVYYKCVFLDGCVEKDYS